MFLTGQLWPKPWDEPAKKKIIPKNHQYYMEKDDMFNSAYHTSAKMANFYLKPKKEFESTMQLNDS